MPLCVSGVNMPFVVFSFFPGELTWLALIFMPDQAYAVYPLFGGGVAEWLKAAVC
jgi:hypothetical protein